MTTSYAEEAQAGATKFEYEVHVAAPTPSTVEHKNLELDLFQKLEKLDVCVKMEEIIAADNSLENEKNAKSIANIIKLRLQQPFLLIR